MKILLPFLLIASAWANSGLLEMLINDKVIANSDLPTEQTQAETIQGDPFTRFFVVGDYGDLTKYNDLHRVTDFMEYLSTQETYDFIATVGDNVYENGIQSMDKLDDVKAIMKAFKKTSSWKYTYVRDTRKPRLLFWLQQRSEVQRVWQTMEYGVRLLYSKDSFER